MKVYWDGLGLNKSASGVYTHALSLAKAMNTFGFKPNLIAHDSNKSEIHFYVNTTESVSGFRGLVFPSKIFFPTFAEKIVLKSNFENNQTIIFHGLSNLNLGILNSKNEKLRYVITVHDIIPLLHPEGISRSLYFQTKYLLPKVLKKADLIVTVSHWTKSKLSEFFPWLDLNKIVVIPNGRPEKILPLKNIQNDSLNLSPTLLCISRGETYKRLGFLVEIFKILKLKYPSLRLHLVTDNKGRELVRKLDFHQNGIQSFLDVDHAFLKELYSKASILVHPSLMEGYGLPVIEAIAQGTKVIFTKGSSMDIFHTESYTKSMDKTATARDWALQIDSFLKEVPSEAMIDQSKLYYESLPTWKQVASQLYNEYQKIISKK